jgi:hypothetical protein
MKKNNLKKYYYHYSDDDVENINEYTNYVYNYLYYFGDIFCFMDIF